MCGWVPDLLLSDAVLLADEVIQFSALHVLQYEYDAILLFKHLVDVDYIGVVEAHQHLYLILCSQEVRLVQLGREDLPRVFANSPLHSATGAVCIGVTLRPIISYNS
jgi:hypothetical protein